MMYLLANFWLWLLLSLLVGLVAGWITYQGRNPNFIRDLRPWVILFLVASLVVLLRLLPSRYGLWAELGLMLAAGYFLGCCISYWLRSARAPAALPEISAVAVTAAAGASSMTTRDVAVEPAAEANAKAEEAASEEAIIGLSAARNGKKDDLTSVYGIDSETEAKMNALGIYHFDQIAAMNPGQSRWLFNRLGHSGRFPSWWWRWKYDAGQRADGKTPDLSPSALMGTSAAETIGASVADQVSRSAKKAVSVAGNLDAGAHEGEKPVGLAEPIAGKPDDLKLIRGVGKVNEGRLHALGVWHFDQIAAWSAEESKWVGSYLAFSGRIESEDWRGQATLLAKGEMPMAKPKS